MTKKKSSKLTPAQQYLLGRIVKHGPCSLMRRENITAEKLEEKKLVTLVRQWPYFVATPTPLGRATLADIS